MEGLPASDGGRAARVAVSSLQPESGLRIDDRIERRQCEIRTGTPVDPRETTDAPFPYPVDVAVTVSTDELTVSPSSTLYVHVGVEGTTGARDRGDVREVEMFETAAVGPGTHAVELSGPVKLYLLLDGPLEIDKQVEDASVRLPEARSIAIGARSYHHQPATTVTTTTDPADLARAVSTFGSALKTTSSERSYGTLRGHPPALEPGQSLSVPDGLEPPEADVHVEVPGRLEAVCTVATLAYYLGCRVRIGDDAVLVVDGTEYDLAATAGLAPTVERTLKRTLFMDCLVRTAGPRRVPQHERRQLEDDIAVDLESLHGQPAAERLARYQTVPFDRIAPHLPAWKVSARLEPGPDAVAALAFLANDLALLECSPAPSGPPTGEDPLPSSRSAGGRSSSGSGPSSSTDSSTGPGRASGPGPTAGEGVVGTAPGEPHERVWIGEGVRHGTSKGLPDAYRNRLARDRREADIEIAVVCNDAEMRTERDVTREVYGSRSDLPFAVTFHEDLETGELASVLASDLDFLHYVGHVDEDGVRCADGSLDARSLGSVGVDVALLNACRSYEQGVGLIEGGAVAAVVTLDDVIETGAVRIGGTMARLLNRGFPVRSALDVARGRSIVGSQYLIVGDGNADISQARGVLPLVAAVDPMAGGHYRLRITTYPTRWSTPGSQFRPAVEGVEEVYLAPRTLPPMELAPDQFSAFLSTGTFPVVLDGELSWSDELDPVQ